MVVAAALVEAVVAQEVASVVVVVEVCTSAFIEVLRSTFTGGATRGGGVQGRGGRGGAPRGSECYLFYGVPAADS